MLVLSRRVNERLLFPDIPAAVRVVSVKPGLVRLGIEAPPDVTVLREEVAGGAEGLTVEAESLPPCLRHRLDALSAGVAQLRRHLAGGANADAATSLDRLERELQALRGVVEETVAPVLVES
jgi:carbon storage regulator CsrA